MAEYLGSPKDEDRLSSRGDPGAVWGGPRGAGAALAWDGGGVTPEGQLFGGTVGPGSPPVDPSWKKSHQCQKKMCEIFFRVEPVIKKLVGRGGRMTHIG